MMTCEKLEQFIDARPLRLRSGAELDSAREHARGCGRCAALLAESESLERSLTSLTIVPPERLATDVMARIRADAEQPAAGDLEASDAASARVSRRETLGWTAALVGNLALLVAYFYSLDPSALVRGLVSPNSDLRGGWLPSMIELGPAPLIMVVGVLLLAAGILGLPGGGTSGQIERRNMKLLQ